MPFSIYIQARSSRWRPGLRLAGNDEDNKALLGKFARKISEIYKDELVNAINTQRYKGSWEPLSGTYLAWKKKNGLSDKIWEATSLLKESIDVWRSNDRLVVGVKRNILYPETNVPVYRVIRWLEFGTSRMSARPLFLPVKRLITGRMSRYWNDFLYDYYKDKDIEEEESGEEGGDLFDD